MTGSQSVSERFDEIVQEAKRIGFSSLPTVTGYLAVMVAVSVMIDTGVLSESLSLVVNIVGIAALYMLTTTMIRESGIAPDGLAAGFGTYFGLALLSGFAMLIGALLLVVPGLILLVRWAPIYGFGLVEGRGVTEAMSDSWAATAEHFWPIAIASLFPVVLTVLGLGVYFYADFAIAADSFEQMDEEGLVSLPVSFAANLALFLSTVMSTTIGLAVFSLVRGPNNTVADVFN